MDTNKGGGGTQKDHVMGTWGGGGLVLVQICPRGLFTAPYESFDQSEAINTKTKK